MSILCDLCLAIVEILVSLRGFSSVGQVGVREPSVTSHSSRKNAVMGGTARTKRRRRCKTRPHRYAKRCGRDLAQEPVGLWSRFRPEGPWKLSPGFSLGGVVFTR